MILISDLDDTLVSSTVLNNDAYNFALEKFGYKRIETHNRITRNNLNKTSLQTLDKIIEEKQRYFCLNWMKYRLVLNYVLFQKLKRNGKHNCFLWTKASKERASSIVKQFELNKIFQNIIYDDKTNFDKSVETIKSLTKTNEVLIYENDESNFRNYKQIKPVDAIKTDIFDVKGYLIKF
ncbi:MAG: NIF family HAD-type phosphatase [Candidatus Caccovivens sp.]